jgi:hypothetical protein
MSFPRKCVSLLAAAAAIAAVAAAPAAAQRGVPPEVLSNDVPAGQVEHGVISRTITGVPAGYERNDRIEYWATSTRFRTRTTDARTGAVRGESFFDGRETVWYSTTRPKVVRFKGHEPWPGAGHPAAYNRKLVERGLLEQVGERTIAGLSGVVYRVRQDRKTSDPNAGEDMWKTDNPAGQTELVFEAGTFRPLQRTNTMENNGEPGRTFRQDEVLISRETRPVTSAAMARLSKAAKRTALKAWKAKLAKRAR